jgi:hypothetical protein
MRLPVVIRTSETLPLTMQTFHCLPKSALSLSSSVFFDLDMTQEMPSLISGVDQLQYRIEVLTYAETYQRTHDVATISNYVLRCVEGAYIGAALDTLLELRGEDARNVLDMLQAVHGSVFVPHLMIY